MPLLDSLLGWMQDPRRTQQMQGLGGSIQGGLLNILDKDKEYQDLMRRAFANPNNPTQVTDPDALAAHTDMSMNSGMAFAPAGMVSGDMAALFAQKAAREKALAKKSINAADQVATNAPAKKNRR